MLMPQNSDSELQNLSFGETETLVSSLNSLLVHLDLPFVLDSPTDLTPSLLLAILQSLLRTRIPVPPPSQDSFLHDFSNDATHESLIQDLADLTIQDGRSKPTPSTKIQQMKIFLGVLENDVLHMDVGISDVDPRRLARGEWNEVVFVGKLLCWLGRQLGVVNGGVVDSSLVEGSRSEPQFKDKIRSGSEIEARRGQRGPLRRTTSPSTHSTITSANTNLSMRSARPTDSITSAVTSVPTHSRSSSGSFLLDVEASHGQSVTSPSSTRTRKRPQCIHEVEEPSFILPALDTHEAENSTVHSHLHSHSHPDNSFSASYCDCDCTCGSILPPDPVTDTLSSPERVPVRRTGWISVVDDGDEIKSFEASRSMRSSKGASRSRGEPASRPTNTHDQQAPPESISSVPHRSTRTERSRNPTPTRNLQTPSPTHIVTKHTSPSQYTIALLNERANLLSELAKLNTRKAT